ncbi:MAG: serine acetyltransferase [Bacteroidetes bacterium]|jgi:serine O-acetyltransferase|nr:serine acetyltransferase [Bacteroidota bacterium]
MDIAVNNQDFTARLYEQYKAYSKELPAINKTHRFADDLINFLFPIKADRECRLPQIELNLAQLQLDFKDLLHPLEPRLKKSVKELTELFFGKIPAIYDSLMNDAKAFKDFDPAAKTIEGIILYYPGFYAIAIYRLAHELYELGIPFVPRMISEYAHSKTGIDIHPGATIGQHFLIDHGTGIVIGETTIIGENVKIYQGVTLGAMFVQKKLKDTKRHPTIEDNVIIYGGTTILGGETTVGHDTVVGGNVWLTKSVPAWSIVYHESKVTIRDSKKYKQPHDFVI